MVKKMLKVEIADTPEKHQKGLMFRNKLGENDGMLFKFKYPQNLKFWGLNTFIPLSIAFVSSEGIIKKIDYISPHSTNAVSSICQCEMAIEANYDFFKNNNIKSGSKVQILKEDEETFLKFM